MSSPDTMRRKYREVTNQETLNKMSLAHQGRTQTQSTRQKISQSMKDYWQTIPSIHTASKPSELSTKDLSAQVTLNP